MTMNGNGQMKKSPEQLEREIDQERHHIQQTLDAIGGKFSPDEMLHRLSDFALRNGGEFSRNIVNTVARNPVPTMLTAIGIGWMLYQYNRPEDDYPMESAGLRDDGSPWVPGTPHKEYVNESSTGHIHGSAGQRINQLRESAGQRAEQLRQSGHAVKENLKVKASGLKERLHTSTDELKHRLDETSADLRDKANHLRQASRRQAQRASEGFNYMLEEQPLVLGAVGVAVGALIGAALPSTRKEDEVLGEVSDRIADEAGAAAHEALNKAVELGKKVQDFAAEDAREKATEFTRDVKDYVKSEARDTAAEVGKTLQEHAETDSNTKPTV